MFSLLCTVSGCMWATSGSRRNHFLLQGNWEAQFSSPQYETSFPNPLLRHQKIIHLNRWLQFTLMSWLRRLIKGTAMGGKRQELNCHLSILQQKCQDSTPSTAWKFSFSLSPFGSPFVGVSHMRSQTLELVKLAGHCRLSYWTFLALKICIDLAFSLSPQRLLSYLKRCS